MTDHPTIGGTLDELRRTNAIVRETAERRKGTKDRRARVGKTDRRNASFRHCPKCGFEKPGWPDKWANAGMPGHTIYVCAGCAVKPKVESK